MYYVIRDETLGRLKIVEKLRFIFTIIDIGVMAGSP